MSACALSLGASLLVSSAASASCVFSKNPTGVTSQVTARSTSDGMQIVNANDLETKFAFKCDVDTNYGLGVVVAGGVDGVIVLRGASGVEVPLDVRLKSINGKKINVDFKDMQDKLYRDSAVAGQNYEVTVVLVPENVKLARGRIAGMLNGNMKFSINY